MTDNTYKSSDQLAQLINSLNKPKTSRFDYYKRILLSCTTDIGFQSMLNTINFKDVVSLPKNNNMFRFVIKCYNNTNNVTLGPVNDNIDFINKSELSIPVYHYHLSKNNYVQDNFVYKITNNETEPISYIL